MIGRLDAIIAGLSELISAVDDNAVSTAAGVGQVLGGAAKSAHYASIYGA
jgi:hypothetical protein